MVTAELRGGSAESASDLATKSNVAMFVAEADMPGATTALIHGVHRALDTAARRLSTPGNPVRYLRTIYLPGEQRCIWMVEACDVATVRLLNDTAQVPFGQIAEVVELSVEYPTLVAEL